MGDPSSEEMTRPTKTSNITFQLEDSTRKLCMASYPESPSPAYVEDVRVCIEKTFDLEPFSYRLCTVKNGTVLSWSLLQDLPEDTYIVRPLLKKSNIVRVPKEDTVDFSVYAILSTVEGSTAAIVKVKLVVSSSMKQVPDKGSRYQRQVTLKVESETPWQLRTASPASEDQTSVIKTQSNLEQIISAQANLQLGGSLGGRASLLYGTQLRILQQLEATETAKHWGTGYTNTSSSKVESSEWSMQLIEDVEARNPSRDMQVQLCYTSSTCPTGNTTMYLTRAGCASMQAMHSLCKQFDMVYERETSTDQGDLSKSCTQLVPTHTLCGLPGRVGDKVLCNLVDSLPGFHCPCILHDFTDMYVAVAQLVLRLSITTSWGEVVRMTKGRFGSAKRLGSPGTPCVADFCLHVDLSSSDGLWKILVCKIKPIENGL